MGTMFQVEASITAIKVPEADGKMRLWRNTSLATLAPGTTATLTNGTLGYEWDEDRDNGFRPAGLVRLSSTTVAASEYLLDYGTRSARPPVPITSPSTGTVGGARLRRRHHPVGMGPRRRPRRRRQHAGCPHASGHGQLFADMGVQPASLQSGLVAATKSTDTTAPTATITSPPPGAMLTNASTVLVTGTAVDAAAAGSAPSRCRSTAGRPGTPPTAGELDLLLSAAATGRSRSSPGPPTTAGTSNRLRLGGGHRELPMPDLSQRGQPADNATTDAAAVELGVKFRADTDVFVTGIRFYKGTGNTVPTSAACGPPAAPAGQRHVHRRDGIGLAAGHLPSAHTNHGRTTYVASYYAPSGHYAADVNYFAGAATDSPPLHALRTGTDGPNGVYRYGAGGGFPTNTTARRTTGSTSSWSPTPAPTSRLPSSRRPCRRRPRWARPPPQASSRPSASRCSRRPWASSSARRRAPPCPPPSPTRRRPGPPRWRRPARWPTPPPTRRR